MKPFWDLEEDTGFNIVNGYKVWNRGSFEDQVKVAQILAKTRNQLNTILIYIYSNPQLINDLFSFGFYHALDIHIPNWQEVLGKKISLLSKLNKCDNSFIYQEITPNEYGIIGLNKPKKVIQGFLSGKDHIATKRMIMLLIRNSNGTIKTPLSILEVAIHELTHTISNDWEWVSDKDGGNHQFPYNSFHKIMKASARKCGILRDALYYEKK